MENASKALLIAAAVLIVILLITFGIRIFQSTFSTGEDTQSVGDLISQQIGAASKDIIGDKQISNTTQNRPKKVTIAQLKSQYGENNVVPYQSFDDMEKYYSDENKSIDYIEDGDGGYYMVESYITDYSCSDANATYAKVGVSIYLLKDMKISNDMWIYNTTTEMRWLSTFNLNGHTIDASSGKLVGDGVVINGNTEGSKIKGTVWLYNGARIIGENVATTIINQ